jgi:hypothetical protein
MKILEACRNIKWDEGISYILEARVTKNQFILAPLKLKLDFVQRILSVDFLHNLVRSNHQDHYLEKSILVKRLKL